MCDITIVLEDKYCRIYYVRAEEAAYEDWHLNLAEEIPEEAMSEFSADILKSYHHKVSKDTAI